MSMTDRSRRITQMSQMSMKHRRMTDQRSRAMSLTIISNARLTTD